MSTRMRSTAKPMSTEAHTTYIERRLADREHTTYMAQARHNKDAAYRAFGRA